MYLYYLHGVYVYVLFVVLCCLNHVLLFSRLQYFARGVQSYIKQLRAALQGKRGEALKTDEVIITGQLPSRQALLPSNLDYQRYHTSCHQACISCCGLARLYSVALDGDNVPLPSVTYRPSSLQNKVKLAALKTTTNIQAIIKDLMHVPPSYKVQVRLSWKPAAAPADSDATAPTKRAAVTKPAAPAKVSKTVPHMDRAVYAPPTGKYSAKAGSAPGEFNCCQRPAIRAHELQSIAVLAVDSWRWWKRTWRSARQRRMASSILD